MKFGVEFEAEYVFRNSIYSRIPDLFGTTHDASIQTPTRKCFLNVSEFFVHGDPIGVEIVSRPLNFSELPIFIDAFKNMVDLLRLCGEKEKSQRAGIHIHIEAPRDFTPAFLKNLLKIGLYIEPLMYAIGGFGYKNHAKTNRFTYARSLLNPPIVYYADRWVYLYELERLFSVRTNSGFFKYMGVDPQNVNRYHPARYLWLNFYAALAHGTVEFRVFNKTFNAKFVKAAIELCRSIVVAAIEKNIPYTKANSVFDQYTVLDLLNLFEDVNQILELDRETKEVIQYLIRIYNPQPIPKENVKTHLRNYSLLYPRDYIPPECTEKIVNPTHVDIHTIRGEV